MRLLTIDDIILFHKKLIKVTGGSDGIRDERMLESSVYSISQTFGGNELYPSLEEKAGWLCYSLINNHAFIDGNKRIGILALLVTLEINGVVLNCTDDELIELGLGLADNSINYKSLLNWIEEQKENI